MLINRMEKAVTKNTQLCLSLNIFGRRAFHMERFRPLIAKVDKVADLCNEKRANLESDEHKKKEQELQTSC